MGSISPSSFDGQLPDIAKYLYHTHLVIGILLVSPWLSLGNEDCRCGQISKGDLVPNCHTVRLLQNAQLMHS